MVDKKRVRNGIELIKSVVLLLIIISIVGVCTHSHYFDIPHSSSKCLKGYTYNGFEE